jgi:hypothetical protein
MTIKNKELIKKLRREIRILKELFNDATNEWDWDDGSGEWFGGELENDSISKEALDYIIKWKKLKGER